VSLFREEDKILIAGDAFVTTNQESVLNVMTQKRALNGPPKYFTSDWDAAFRSVKQLADLEPAVVATGHGKPMAGPTMQDELHELAENFEHLAKPSHGRYINDAALTNEEGVVYLPDALPVPRKRVAALILLGALVLTAALLVRRNNSAL
jgi:glyoxylase-like metal-dependent hydrolase (beta-lactamase superfamily II)